MVRLLSFMYKIFSYMSFMCRTYTEIQLQTSILVLLLEQVRTQGRAKSRLGKETFRKKVDQSTTNRKQGDLSRARKSGHSKQRKS